MQALYTTLESDPYIYIYIYPFQFLPPPPLSLFVSLSICLPLSLLYFSLFFFLYYHHSLPPSLPLSSPLSLSISLSFSPLALPPFSLSLLFFQEDSRFFIFSFPITRSPLCTGRHGRFSGRSGPGLGELPPAVPRPQHAGVQAHHCVTVHQRVEPLRHRRLVCLFVCFFMGVSQKVVLYL